jgi:HK97 family phage portal protein
LETEVPNRKREFHARLGEIASSAQLRSANLKQIDLWRQMFPSMFDWLDTSIPTVSPASGQRLSLVYSCLNVLGETRGAVPFQVKRYGPNGSENAYDHPVYRLIHDRPNPFMTAFSFWSTVEKLKHIHGNAYALIDRDAAYEPSALYLVDPTAVAVDLTQSGEVYYKYYDKRIRHTDILHFKNYSVDGYCGVSTITANSLSVGLGLKLKHYNSTLIGNRPPGYLTGPKPKDELQKGQQKGLWNKQLGPEGQSESFKADTIRTNSFGDIPYLYGGVEFKAMTLPADQAAYIAGTELNDRDILGMFRMPPTMVSIYKDAPYNSSEQQDIAFAKYTLASSKEYEQECTEKLFPTSNQRREKSYYCQFNLNGLLRGDLKTRQAFYTGLFNIAAITPNQICEFEDLPTYGPDGDKHYVQGALVPVDMVADFILSKSAKQENQPDNQKTEQKMREEIREEFREKMKSRLNGHYKQVADLLE